MADFVLIRYTGGCFDNDGYDIARYECQGCKKIFDMGNEMYTYCPHCGKEICWR